MERVCMCGLFGGMAMDPAAPRPAYSNRGDRCPVCPAAGPGRGGGARAGGARARARSGRLWRCALGPCGWGALFDHGSFKYIHV